MLLNRVWALAAAVYVVVCFGKTVVFTRVFRMSHTIPKNTNNTNHTPIIFITHFNLWSYFWVWLSDYLIFIADLPFSLRLRIREEMSLNVVFQAWHLTLAGDGIFIQIICQRNQLVSCSRSLQGNQLLGVETT